MKRFNLGLKKGGRGRRGMRWEEADSGLEIRNKKSSRLWGWGGGGLGPAEAATKTPAAHLWLWQGA